MRSPIPDYVAADRLDIVITPSGVTVTQGFSSYYEPFLVGYASILVLWWLCSLTGLLPLPHTVSASWGFW